MLHSPPGTLTSSPLHLYVLPNPYAPATLTLVTSPPITTYVLDPLPFFEGQIEGLRQVACGEELPNPEELKLGVDQRTVIRFERTPDGEGVGAIRLEGAGETWSVNPSGRAIKSRGRWKLDDVSNSVDNLVVLDRGIKFCVRISPFSNTIFLLGKQFVTYSSATQQLVLHIIPPISVELPNLISVFSLPPDSSSTQSAKSGTLVAITAEHEVVLIDVNLPSTNPNINIQPALRISSRSFLPINPPSSHILPVDPMAWTGPYLSGKKGMDHDVLLSVTAEGELAFWVPNDVSEGQGWKCTGKVRTGRTGLKKARCSSAKKSALGKFFKMVVFWYFDAFEANMGCLT